MIKMRRAFNRHTTTTCYLQLSGEGFWDDNNEWVEGVATPPQPFMATATPVGMNSVDSFGTTLEARPEGERSSTYLQFTSKMQMPMKAIIFYKEFKFKIVRVAEYSAAGFYSVIAENIRGKHDSRP
ncbi:MAG: hypothetical protein ACRCUS_00610 [Anaerovoracaceae bacterium]